MSIIKATTQILVFTFSLLSFANADSLKRYDGTYVGLSVGGDFGSVKVNTLALAPGLKVTGNEALSANGVTGGIYAGYGMIVGGIYAGGELAGELYSSKGNTSITFSNGVTGSSLISIKRVNGFSVAGRLGKQINEAILYAKVGVALPQYRLQSALSAAGVGGAPLNASGIRSKRLVQVIGGLGAEHIIGKISSHAEVRCGVEYEHTFSRKIPVALNSSTFTSANTTFSPSVDSLKLKLMLKF